jgi:hypothetical protein
MANQLAEINVDGFAISEGRASGSEVASGRPICSVAIDFASDLVQPIGEVVAFCIFVGQAHDVFADYIRKASHFANFH